MPTYADQKSFDLLAAARIEYVTHRDESRIESGLTNVQDMHAAAETHASYIAEWQPAMVPGLVQTAAYTRELLERPDRPSLTDPGDIDPETIATGRIKRPDLLYQPGRRIELILGEAALRSTPGTIRTQLGQLDRLVSVIDLPTVELGIVPFPLMPVMPLSSFYIHDEIVYLETLTAEQRLFEPDEVAVYQKAFQLLREAAVTGPEREEDPTGKNFPRANATTTKRSQPSHPSGRRNSDRQNQETRRPQLGSAGMGAH